jgi:hypothetical protein
LCIFTLEVIWIYDCIFEKVPSGDGNDDGKDVDDTRWDHGSQHWQVHYHLERSQKFEEVLETSRQEEAGKNT